MTRLTRIIAGAAFGAVLATSAPAQDVPDADTVLATVNGTEITLGHVIALTWRLPQQYKSLGDEDLYNGILEQLIQQTAMMQEIEGELNKEARLSLENERRAFMAAELIDRIGKEEISEAAVEAAYEAQYANADEETEAHAAHILVETEEEAKEIAGLLADGGDFAELARERSTGPSGPGGGDLGWLTFGEVVKPFAEALFALEPGEISDPVQSQFGWHVIQLKESRIKEAPPLKEVRGDLEESIRNQKINDALAGIAEEADIERADVEIDPSIIRDMGLLAE
ncbi:peptidylprolyl isomerase [Maritimibacter sp. 55A14]|uniref:peptidylprolyl isomerase n=1 Tax=Maritimibacter sp. 55A14 TaxID=2174844 RepID=UPI000D60CE7B|nr:peptidylprolyl isomerase [Maritimibacter sp. 55A14]PWE33532.1 peptidylprolyl isomerase [Maritimibacter sp. 55A14]